MTFGVFPQQGRTRLTCRWRSPAGYLLVHCSLPRSGYTPQPRVAAQQRTLGTVLGGSIDFVGAGGLPEWATRPYHRQVQCRAGAGAIPVIGPG